jgi:hypothetical protein
MSQLRLRKKPPAASLRSRRRLEINRLTHDRALHYLANHPISDEVRAQLTEIVLGYITRCDEAQERKGLEWLRERYRVRGERPPL